MVEIWGDEAGNFDFTGSGSQLFIVCTTTVRSRQDALVSEVLALRRVLHASGHELRDGFHATEDRQAVRDAMFALIASHDIQIDATIYTKARIYPSVSANVDYFYKWAWFYHLRFALPRAVPAGGDVFIGIATLGVKKKHQAYAHAVRDVVRQSLRPGSKAQCAYWSAGSHPSLQVADYCTWAIGRWKEGADRRSYDLIQHLVRSCYTFV